MKLNKLIIASFLIGASFISYAKKEKDKKKKKKGEEETETVITLKTKQDTLSFSIGYNMGEGLKQGGLDTHIDINLLNEGMKQSLDTAKPLLSPEESIAFLQAYFQKIQKEKSEIEEQAVKEQEKTFFDTNKKNEGVIETASGLQYQIITEGNGPKPSAEDRVTVHYTGMLLDGTVFDSSVERGEPATFPVNGVIQGWVEALQLMPAGSKWKLFIPSALAYGSRGAGQSIPPNSILIFEVELLSIQ